MKLFRIIFVIACHFCFVKSFAQPLPIKPSRTVSFETDEGSYMNLAVSPDGQTLLFDLLGDIYSLPVKGGRATQITRGLAVHAMPVFSRNGKKMAYQSDASGRTQMHVSNLDGTGEQVMGNSNEFSFETMKVNKDLSGIPINAIVSVNGEFAAYVSKPEGMASSLVLKKLGAGKEEVLVSRLVLSDSTAGYGQKFCFSPDSKKIYISYGGKIHQISTETGKDEVIPFIANVNADLGKLNRHSFKVSQGPFNSNYIRGGVTSLDGKWLYFVALSQLYRMSLPNGKAVPVTRQEMGQFQPAVSPDGKWIAYVGWSDEFGGGLWKVPSMGGTPVQLTKTPGHYQQPSWSPDGKRIAVIRRGMEEQRAEDFEFGRLELVAADGTKNDLVNDTVPLWNKIYFSPDGKRLFYRAGTKNVGNRSPSYYRKHSVLVSSDLRGYNLKVEVMGELDIDSVTMRHYELFRQHQQLSPDGKYMVYAEHESLFLVPVEKKGMELPMIYSKVRNPKAVRFSIGMDPYWEDNGKMICWTSGNKFYKVRTDKIIETADLHRKQRMSKGLVQEEYSTAEVVPDKVVDIKVETPSLYGKGTIALKNVRILSMNGNQVIESGTIIIQNGRIRRVGNVDRVPIPNGAKVMDLEGKTVMPGIVDVHLHMRLPSNIYQQQNHQFLTSLAYGVTTARDPVWKFDAYTTKELLMAGKMIGPRFYFVGRPASLLTSRGIERMDSYEDAQYFIRKRKLLGDVVVKMYGLPTRQQRQWLLQASDEAGLNMTNEGESWLLNLAMIKDGSSGVEHDPEGRWRDVYKDVIRLISESKTCITPTLQYTNTNHLDNGRYYFNYTFWSKPDSKLKYFLDSNQLKKLLNSKPMFELQALPDARVDARLRKAGALISMGSHGDDIGIGPHSEIWALQMGGMSNMEALQSATIIGAKALGMDKDLGSIEVGKIADLIILNKNPLDDIHNSREIRYVMKDGVLYDGDTLETLWPFKRPAPEWRYKGEYETLIKHTDKP